MVIPGDSELLEVMHGLNPWWVNPAYQSWPVHRTAFHETARWFFKPDFERALVLSGPRRVGKTVILHQLAQESIARGSDPRDVLYLTMDHPVIRMFGLDAAIKAYRDNIRPGTGQVVLLLDELQYLPDWPTWIKLTVDFRREFRIVATGSVAVEIAPASQESAAGRWLLIRVPTLSFTEFLSIAGLEAPVLPDDISVMSLASMEGPERTALVAGLAGAGQNFHDFLMRGGFPELARETDSAEAQARIREDVINRVLKYDLAGMFGVRRLPELERLFVYFCVNSGGLLDQAALSRALGLHARTVSDYIDHLAWAGLIHVLPSVETGGKASLKARPKVYVSDASIRNAVLMKGSSVLSNDDEMGLLVETVVYQHLLYWGYREGPQLGYWRNRSGREVDFVRMSVSGGLLPIEVKYKSRSTSADRRNIVEFMERSGAQLGIMAVRHAVDMDVIDAGPGRLLVLPAWLLLMIIGHEADIQAKGAAWKGE